MPFLMFTASNCQPEDWTEKAKYSTVIYARNMIFLEINCRLMVIWYSTDTIKEVTIREYKYPIPFDLSKIRNKVYKRTVFKNGSCDCSQARTRPFIKNKSYEITVPISTTQMHLQNLFCMIINAEIKETLYPSFELKSGSLVNRHQ
jgi:hypothetical protein